MCVCLSVPDAFLPVPALCPPCAFYLQGTTTHAHTPHLYTRAADRERERETTRGKMLSTPRSDQVGTE